jgi:hypothetical protein
MSETPYLTPGVEETSPGLMQRATAIAPFVRYVPKNPLILIGAAAIGIAGVLAWRNRRKIADTARPLLQNAAAKGSALAEQAKAKGEELVEAAKDATEAVAAKARRGRGTTPTDSPVTGVH